MTTNTNLTDALTEKGLCPSVRKILKVYRSATPEQMTAGINWYADAHALAVALDPKNVLRAAGVISALSPRNNWIRNQALAIRAYADGFASGTLAQQCKAANTILDGAPLESALRGPKTQAFAYVIADPTDTEHVVIDRHAVSVAIGRVSDDNDTDVLNLKGAYDLFADAYRRAAKIAGVSPSIMQAVTWVAWRETKIRTKKAARRERLALVA